MQPHNIFNFPLDMILGFFVKFFLGMVDSPQQGSDILSSTLLSAVFGKKMHMNKVNILLANILALKKKKMTAV